MEIYLEQKELKIPQQLNQKFLEKVIKTYEKDSNAKVHEFSISPGSAQGDNFGSQIFRIKIKYSAKNKENCEISVIAKFIDEGMSLGVTPFEMFRKLFKVEEEIYRKVLPEFEDLLKEKFWPGFIYSELDTFLIIILEDVSQLGFNKIISYPTQDFEVSKLAVKKLAKFHAASFYLQNEQKYDFSHFNYNYHLTPEIDDLIVKKILTDFIPFMKEREEFKDFIPDLEHYRDFYYEINLKSFEPNKGPFGFNVLNHADFWVKNVLWKLNEKKNEEDFCLVDYQTCFYGTPALDLTYALFYFLSNENRKNRRDEFIATYHAQFDESLKSFGFLKQIPSLLDLQVELLKNGNLQALIGLTYSIFTYYDIQSITKEEREDPVGLAEKMFKCEEYQEILKWDLPRIVYSGALRKK